ncbi:hypothetical protein BKA66DRAFT_606444 [Pyrenochaeta sp. MPI-SDFR-AT-0127]|nr:hypothetical protein BKA66DRAFT_606444 [Pyrenochaeta sp. MPI-SDFR-AT-0127]
MYSMPCKHIILGRMATGAPLEVTDFHPHWWLDRTAASEEVPPRPREPIPIPQRRRRGGFRGRGSCGSGPWGTRREPASFELQDTSQSRRWVWLEGKHYRRTGPSLQTPLLDQNEQAPTPTRTTKKVSEELEREIVQRSEILQLARRKIDEANSCLQDASSARQALPTIDELDNSIYVAHSDSVSDDFALEADDGEGVGQRISEDGRSALYNTLDPQPIVDCGTLFITSSDRSSRPSTPHISEDIYESIQSIKRSISIADGSTNVLEGQEANPGSSRPQTPIAQKDDTRLEAIKFARFIKSKGKARPLFELEYSDLLRSRKRTPEPTTLRRSYTTKAPSAQRTASKPQRVRQEPILACLCSKKCDGRYLRNSIVDIRNATCYGNI